MEWIQLNIKLFTKNLGFLYFLGKIQLNQLLVIFLSNPILWNLKGKMIKISNLRF
jgi:hypothetical protein